MMRRRYCCRHVIVSVLHATPARRVNEYTVQCRPFEIRDLDSLSSRYYRRSVTATVSWKQLYLAAMEHSLWEFDRKYPVLSC
jgi:hypothetical protein